MDPTVNKICKRIGITEFLSDFKDYDQGLICSSEAEAFLISSVLWNEVELETNDCIYHLEMAL